MIEISEAEYRDKVYGCWLGKNIGGTLGAPYEGSSDIHKLDFYKPAPKKAAPNDDLDLQLVWLKMLEDVGVHPALPHFAEYWRKYAIYYPWNEYGFLRRNLLRGLMPPITGCFENYYLDEMGSPIRSEIWACIAPGDPQLAAAMAWKDAVLDHAGGEGMYGEMFLAALESAAFVLKDPKTLIQIGLNMIPLHSAISRVVREAVWCAENNFAWEKARARIVQFYGHHSPCHAVQNLGFTIIGWLYGKDFGDRLCKAVNCGYDTDCTGASLGALLGILGGSNAIPQKWRAPIGDEIVLHKLTQQGGLVEAPKTTQELTTRTVAIAKNFLRERSDVATLATSTKLPDNVLPLLFRNEKTLLALHADLQSGVMLAGNVEVTLHYGGEPVIRPGIEKTIGISLRRAESPIEAPVTLSCPTGWNVRPAPDLFRQKRFILSATAIELKNEIKVTISVDGEADQTQFTFLGPEAARGVPSGVNIPETTQGSGEDWLKRMGISKK